MDLTKLDDLDERQKALDSERTMARQEVLKEIQFLISRIDARPDELSFSSTRTSSRIKRTKRSTNAHTAASTAQP